MDPSRNAKFLNYPYNTPTACRLLTSNIIDANQNSLLVKRQTPGPVTEGN